MARFRNGNANIKDEMLAPVQAFPWRASTQGVNICQFHIRQFRRSDPFMGPFFLVKTFFFNICLLKSVTLRPPFPGLCTEDIQHSEC